jgi:phosphatidate phosphatase APP1
MISNPPEEQNRQYYKGKRKIYDFKKWLRKKIKLVNYPFIAAYRGFGNLDYIHIKGHTFRSAALPSERKSNSVFRNTLAVIKRFLMKPMEGARIQLVLQGKILEEAYTDANGFYQFNLPNPGLHIGWHTFKVLLVTDEEDIDQEISVEEELLIPHETEYGFISDIDDTFLVSHATNIFKKLYTLLTKNVETRKPFKGVAEHYKRLARGRDASMPNPFFYVSSSEWNLYEFVVDFCEFHGLPKGIFLLNDLKRIGDFFKSGLGDHFHKQKKIREILNAFPDMNFVLLGDSGQSDPDIYHAIATEFPEQIAAIYIRDVRRKTKSNVQRIKRELEETGIEVILFKHSSEAMKHSSEKLFSTKK